MGQMRIYNTVVEYYKKHGYPPTVREIQDATGVKSISTIHYHIQKMIELGMLETDAENGRASRAIRIPGYSYNEIQENITFAIIENLLENGKLDVSEIAKMCFVPEERVVKIKNIMDENPFR